MLGFCNSLYPCYNSTQSLLSFKCSLPYFTFLSMTPPLPSDVIYGSPWGRSLWRSPNLVSSFELLRLQSGRTTSLPTAEKKIPPPIVCLPLSVIYLDGRRKRRRRAGSIFHEFSEHAANWTLNAMRGFATFKVAVTNRRVRRGGEDVEQTKMCKTWTSWLWCSWLWSPKAFITDVMRNYFSDILSHVWKDVYRKNWILRIFQWSSF